jgi:thymidylate synthase (FAD)
MEVTQSGTAYFVAPEVALIGKTTDGVQSLRVAQFLRELDGSFYPYVHESRSGLSDPELLTKFAGQLDYLSFGPGHTPHNQADRYFTHIRQEGHGSILEHAYFSILCWGISRSCTHEIVRHRAGFSYSQVSQRYVTRIRFVERPEYQASPGMHNIFIQRIDNIAGEYEIILRELPNHMPRYEDEPLTNYRKRMRQVARSMLPNETEASIIITANVRAWRHFLEMRASQYAEVEIRQLAMEIYYVLLAEAPLLFDDYEKESLMDGTMCLSTETRKV